MSKEALLQNAAKLALKALKTCTRKCAGTRFQEWYFDEDNVKEAIKSLEEALAKQEQGEPDYPTDEDGYPIYCNGTHEQIAAAHAKFEQSEPDDLMIAYMSGLHDGKKLAKQEQGEPVAWLHTDGSISFIQGCGYDKPLYTTPQPQQEQGEPVETDWERIARVQNAKLMAMCGEAGGFEKLCEVMDKYEATTPQQRTWVGLTEDEMKLIDPDGYADGLPQQIQQALKEKNT